MAESMPETLSAVPEHPGLNAGTPGPASIEGLDADPDQYGWGV
jgi:hypothetical protein